MPERSVVVRLRGDIADLKAKMREGSVAVASVGDAAVSTSSRSKVAFADLAKSIGANEQSIDRLAGGALKVGAGLGVGVGLVVKTFADFDKQMSAVAATGTDARINIDALTKSAIELGSSTAFSATEAAQGVENLLKAGVDAADVMGGGLKGSLDLAAAGSLGVGEAAEIAATAMTQFKLEGKDVPHIADLLAAGAGKAQGEVSDMAAALKQSGLVASQFGLSIEETSGTLAAFASAGLLGSDAGTSFRTMLLSLANPSKESADEMERLGIAAYDAQGNFVGMENLAEQLQVRLGGLEQSERDAALAQIFGNDAVRAANVLYTQGGEGIKEWTANVDDAGFAAETAETKLDNLSGDLETFKGAIESAFIESGGGANDALRGLVQGATDLVEKIGDIPGPALEAGLGVAAVGAAALLTIGGIGKLAIGVSETVEAVVALRKAAPGAAGVIGDLGKSAALAAGFVVALTLAGEGVERVLKITEPRLEDVESGLLALAKGGEDATGSLDAFFAATETKTDLGFTESVDDLGGALGRLLDKSTGQKINDFATGIVSALGGAAGTADQLTEKFEAVDQSLEGMVAGGKADEAAAAFNQIADAAEAQGISLDALLELFPEYHAALKEQANELGGLKLTTEEYVAWMGGEVPPAVREAAEASDEARTSTVKLAGAQDVGAKSAEDLKEELDDLVDSLFDVGDAALDASGAQIDFEQAVDDAYAAVKENGKGLDIHTQKGRDNKRALDNLAESSQSLIEKMVEQRASTKDVTRATEDAREEFIKVAEKMTGSRKAAEKLADGYGLIPRDVKTKVSAPGADATRDKVTGLRTDIRSIDGRSVNVRVGFTAGGQRVILKPGTLGGGLTLAGATGGVLPGWSPGRDIHRFVSPTGGQLDLSGGESIMRPEWTRMVGGAAEVARQNAAAVAGQTFAVGGVFRNINAHFTAGSRPPVGAIAGRIMSQVVAKILREARDEVAAQMSGGVGPTDVNNPRGLTSFRGGTFTNLAVANLRAAERIAGQTLRVMQGGWRHATSYSGTSHAGDAVDAQTAAEMIRALRRVGWASGDRTGLGNWGPHSHSVPTPGHGFAGGSAIGQAQDYLRRGGPAQSLGSAWGLAGGALIRGGRGGMYAHIGEGARDELVTPLPAGWDRQPVYRPADALMAAQTRAAQPVATREVTLAQSIVGNWDPEIVAKKVQGKTLDALTMAGLATGAP